MFLCLCLTNYSSIVGYGSSGWANESVVHWIKLLRFSNLFVSQFFPHLIQGSEGRGCRLGASCEVLCGQMLFPLVLSLNVVLKGEKCCVFCLNLFSFPCWFILNLCQQKSAAWIECVIMNIIKQCIHGKPICFSLVLIRLIVAALSHHHLQH